MKTLNHPGRWAVLFLVMALALPAALVWAHGGHGKTELQFKVVPKNVESPGASVIKMGGITISRQEFFDYIRNTAAFQMRADLIQRDFLLHFWVIEGVSRYYPTDINDLFARLEKLGPESPEFAPRLNEWILAQADLFARLSHYAAKAKRQPWSKAGKISPVLEMFAQKQKADLMEDVIKYGAMPPSRMGVRKFAASLSADDRAHIERHYKDPKDIKPFEVKETKRRWIQYRRDLLANTPNARLYLKVQSMSVPPATPIAKVNDHVITMGDFLSIYGPMVNDTNWNNVKKSRVPGMMLAYAMADEADHLGVVPQWLKAKIALSKKMYLAAGQIIREFGPATLGETTPEINFAFYRKIVYFPNLLKFEKFFVEKSGNLPAGQKLWIDKDYLTSLAWIVEPAYTPEQASYF
ncbi:MAG: hypothetical protein P9L99_21105 [Candidatus Lernaella stagnicola]|nr:hypothetical protein [Candidatus Lernaella stagnicola]